MPKPTPEGITLPAGDLLQVIFRTSHHLHRQFETGLSALDIPAYMTGPRLRFLIAVEEAGKIRMNEMAARIGIQPRTVTQFVDALEQEGLLVRVPDPGDRRAIFLQLTEKAPPLIRHARAAMASVAENVLEPLPPGMRRQLFEILMRLNRFNP